MKITDSRSDLSKRICFFELVKSDLPDNIVYNTNSISWISVFETITSKETLGISQAGEWVFRDAEKFYVLKNKRMYLHCAKLLEIPFDVIQIKIEDRFRNILKNREISFIDVFPFFEIIEFAFDNLPNDYWFELAWVWYKKFPLSERYELIALLDDISVNKKFSQKNRQKVKREIREIKRAVEA